MNYIRHFLGWTFYIDSQLHNAMIMDKYNLVAGDTTYFSTLDLQKTGMGLKEFLDKIYSEATDFKMEITEKEIEYNSNYGLSITFKIDGHMLKVGAPLNTNDFVYCLDNGFVLKNPEALKDVFHFMENLPSEERLRLEIV